MALSAGFAPYLPRPRDETEEYRNLWMMLRDRREVERQYDRIASQRVGDRWRSRADFVGSLYPLHLEIQARDREAEERQRVIEVAEEEARLAGVALKAKASEDFLERMKGQPANVIASDPRTFSTTSTDALEAGPPHPSRQTFGALIDTVTGEREEVNIPTAEYQRQIKRDDERYTRILDEEFRPQPAPKTSTETITIPDEQGIMRPRTLVSTTSFDPETNRWTTTRKLQEYQGEPVIAGAPPTTPVKRYTPTTTTKEGYPVFRNVADPEDTFIAYDEVLGTIAAAKAGIEDLELGPIVSETARRTLLDAQVRSRDPHVPDDDTVVAILEKDFSEAGFNSGAITGVFHTLIQTVNKLAGTGESSRLALQRLSDSKVLLLQTLSDERGRPGEGERTRIENQIGKLEGGTFVAQETYFTELYALREMLVDMVEYRLKNLPAGTDTTSRNEQTSWRAMASAAEYFANAVGLPSILGEVTTREYGQPVYQDPVLRGSGINSFDDLPDVTDVPQ
jgi:hypothetical protein